MNYTAFLILIISILIYLYIESIKFEVFKLFKQDASVDDVNTDINIFSARVEVFVGRDDIFAVIDIKNDKKIKVLFGLPGVGKTSVAKEYAYRRIDEGSFDEVYWFDADAEYKINEMLYQYGTKNPNFKSGDGRFETINRFLISIQGSDKVLLIFDNVEVLADVTNTVNIKLFKCKTIITTKNASIVPKYAAKIEVNPFGIDEMTEYIKRTLSNLDTQQVSKLVEKIQIRNECLPYQLSMLTTILRNDPTTNIDELLESDYSKSNTYLMRILDKIRIKEPQAVELLKYLVILDPDNIPYKLIERILEGNKQKAVIQAILDQNICTIVKPNTPQYGLKFHRLLQDDLDKYFNLTQGNNNVEIANNLQNIINDLFPQPSQDPDEKWEEASLYYPHAVKIIEKIYKPKNDLFTKIGRYNGLVINNYNRAIEYLHKALKKNALKEINQYNAYLYSNLGFFYSKRGNTDKAFENYHMALDMYLRLFNGDHASIADSYYNIGAEYSKIGNTDKALENYHLALDMYLRLLNGDRADIANIYYNIGLEYAKRGNTDKAFENYHLALDIYLRLFNGDRADIAKTYYNIGLEYSKRGNTDKALEYKQLALDMYLRLFKGDRADIAKTYYNIGLEYSKRGNTDKALEYKQLALDMYLRLFNGDRAYIANTFNSIGAEYSKSGNTDKALENYHLALDMYLRLFKGDHANIADSYNDIGIEYSKIGNTDKALENYHLALDMYLRLFKGDHPKIADSYHNIGLEYSKIGNTDKALENYHLALDMYLRLFKGDHANIADSYHNIGLEYSKIGNTDKALENYHLSLDMYLRLFKGDHAYIANSYYNIGLEYSKIGNTDKGLENYHLALDMYLRLFKGDHAYIADSYYNIGLEYSNQGNTDKALEYKQLALDMYLYV